MAQKETPILLERTYNVPLRREYLKVPRWRRTEKAVVALKQFLQKHMKSDQVKLGKKVNEKLWQHGLRNPPHHVKITAVKDEKGEVKVELFDIKPEVPKKETVPKKKEKAESLGEV